MRAAVITSSHRRVVACVLAVVAVALVVVFGVWGGSSSTSARQHHAARSPRSSPTAYPTVPAVPSSSSTGDSTTLPPLVRTDDPVAYVRAVAGALFGVANAEISRGAYLRFWTGELPSVVYADAAAKGLTLSVQNADAIDNLTAWWIPAQRVWNSEAAQHTTSRFVVTSVSVPDYWVNAVADGTLRDPGLRMERVMGVLTQSYGIDPAHRQTASRSVVIDLGLLCGPTQPGGCHLLAPQQPPSTGA